MFLSKKSMFKDGSFSLILIQSGTMLHFPRYFSSSRQTWENWFICFERTYVGVVFVTKFPRATIMSLQKSSSKNAQNSNFLEMPAGQHGLEDWL